MICGLVLVKVVTRKLASWGNTSIIHDVVNSREILISLFCAALAKGDRLVVPVRSTQGVHYILGHGAPEAVVTNVA